MPPPVTRYGLRGTQFTRQWKIVVLLRLHAHTVESLARLLGCSTRTVRRDIEALEAVPLPIHTVSGINREDPTYYRLGLMDEWPKGQPMPTTQLRSLKGLTDEQRERI